MTFTKGVAHGTTLCFGGEAEEVTLTFWGVKGRGGEGLGSKVVSVTIDVGPQNEDWLGKGGGWLGSNVVTAVNNVGHRDNVWLMWRR